MMVFIRLKRYFDFPYKNRFSRFLPLERQSRYYPMQISDWISFSCRTRNTFFRWNSIEKRIEWVKCLGWGDLRAMVRSWVTMIQPLEYLGTHRSVDRSLNNSTFSSVVVATFLVLWSFLLWLLFIKFSVASHFMELFVFMQSWPKNTRGMIEHGLSPAWVVEPTMR